MLTMLVEDDELLRSLLMESLEEKGWQVIACETAEAALIFEGTSPEVLVTDVNFGPGLDGTKLALRARQKWPCIGVVIMSGRPLPTGVLLKQHERFISKPFGFTALLSCMHDVVDCSTTEVEAITAQTTPAYQVAASEGLLSRFRP